MQRRWCLPLATLALAGGSMLAATSAAAASSVTPSPGSSAGRLARPFALNSASADATTSPTLSGYVAHTRTYSSVSASWTEPAGTCHPGTQYSDFWAGLDGYNDGTVEQTGTDVDCVGGSARYYGWYEMYPRGRVNFSNTVRPGDHLTASVRYDGGGEFTLKLSDRTRGWTRAENKTLSSARRLSAEVIVEDPAAGVPLANFGTVTFTGARIDGSPLANQGPTKVTMVSGSTRRDSVSAISGGTKFSVRWLHG